MRLIKPAVLVLALIVLTTSIGGLLFNWSVSSLTGPLSALMVGLILLRAQFASPNRTFPPNLILVLGIILTLISAATLVLALYRSDVVMALASLPALALLGHVLVRSLRDRRAKAGPAGISSSR